MCTSDSPESVIYGLIGRDRTNIGLYESSKKNVLRSKRLNAVYSRVHWHMVMGHSHEKPQGTGYTGHSFYISKKGGTLAQLETRV